MARHFRSTKISLIALFGFLVLSDASMVLYLLDSASSLSPEQELAAQNAQIKLLRADVARARDIRLNMPGTKADCDRFDDSLPPVRLGYSVITAEFEQLGRESGLQISSLAFRPTDLAARGMTELAVDAKVAGNYKSVVRFLNGVQRSQNYYVLDSLSLSKDSGAPGSTGTVNVDLHMKSYFKGAP
jgi:Tfp pilus assembly protein PilO